MRKVIGVIEGFLLILFAAAPAFADTSVNICPQTAPFAQLCQLTSGNFGGAVSAIITILFILAVVIAIIFLVWGGIKWILSGGDKTAVESARNHIIAAIVGLIIALASYFILRIILGLFNIEITNFVLPKLF